MKTGALILASSIVLLAGCASAPPAVVVINNKCILPPSPVAQKEERQLKASLDVVKKSGEIGPIFKSEGQKLLEINEELLTLYALGTFCLMSEGLAQPEQAALRDNINAIIATLRKERQAAPTPATKAPAPALPESAAMRETLHVTKELTSSVKLELRTLALAAALSLGLPPAGLRANVFMQSKDGKHRIADDFTHNMFTVGDRTIAIPNGFGSTGVAYVMGELIASFLKTQKAFVIQSGIVYPIGTQEPFVLPPNEQAKVDPDLTWIFSAPLTDESSRAVLGVMNLTCSGAACRAVTPEKLAQHVEREMRIRADRVAGLLERSFTPAKKP